MAGIAIILCIVLLMIKADMPIWGVLLFLGVVFLDFAWSMASKENDKNGEDL